MKASIPTSLARSVSRMQATNNQRLIVSKSNRGLCIARAINEDGGDRHANGNSWGVNIDKAKEFLEDIGVLKRPPMPPTPPPILK